MTECETFYRETSQKVNQVSINSSIPMQITWEPIKINVSLLASFFFNGPFRMHNDFKAIILGSAAARRAGRELCLSAIFFVASVWFQKLSDMRKTVNKFRTIF